MDQTMNAAERMSALADDRLDGEDFARALDSLDVEAGLRETWRTWHVIGDVLRTGGHAPCTDPGAFMTRLQARLASEEAPRPVVSIGRAAAVAPVVAAARIEAANEPVFRWKLIAGAASVAAAAVIGWTWVGSGLSAAPASVLAAAGTSASVSNAPVSTRVVVGAGSGGGEAQVMLRDARLDELLDAHRQVASSAQMPSGFLRSATFDAPPAR